MSAELCDKAALRLQREECPIVAFSPIFVWTPGKQKQEQSLGEVLEELRAKLQWTQGELEAQREAERQRQVQVGVQGRGGEALGAVPCHAQDSLGAQIPTDFPEPEVRDRGPPSLMWGMSIVCLERTRVAEGGAESHGHLHSDAEGIGK